MTFHAVCGRTCLPRATPVETASIDPAMKGDYPLLTYCHHEAVPVMVTTEPPSSRMVPVRHLEQDMVAIAEATAERVAEGHHSHRPQPLQRLFLPLLRGVA